MVLDDTQLAQVVSETEETQETPDNVAAEQEKQQAQPALSSKEINMRNMREKAEQLQRERDEALRKLQEFQAAQQSKVESPDEDIVIGQDEIAEGKHLRQITKQIKELKQQLKQSQQQSADMSVETRLKNRYPDFDSIVSRENIEALRAQYPEVAATINSSPDLESKSVSAYTLIKKLGIVQQPDGFEEDRARIQRNAAKPRPVTSVSPQQGDTPLSRANAFANGLTPELQAQLRKEMQEAMKNH